MKKGLLLTLLVVFSWVGIANALSYTDLDSTSVTFKKSAGTVAYTWSFDLVNDDLAEGDITSNDIINTAYLGFSVKDDDGDSLWFLKDFFTEFIDITINGVKYVDDWEMDNGDWYIPSSLITALSGSIVDFTVTFDDYYGWKCTTDTTVFNVKIYGEYTQVAPVPEPGTFILLGAGLAGLGFYRRKYMK